MLNGERDSPESTRLRQSDFMDCLTTQRGVSNYRYLIFGRLFVKFFDCVPFLTHALLAIITIIETACTAIYHEVAILFFLPLKAM